MTAPTTERPDAEPIHGGWRVRRDDGTKRVVLPRLDTGWAVFDGGSSFFRRNPSLGYSDSWTQDVDAAIKWARNDGPVG